MKGFGCVSFYFPHFSAPSEDTGDDKQKVLNDFKDDYWYYDVATDGYYYEQNGAKGWRRRMPNGWKGKQQMAPGHEVGISFLGAVVEVLILGSMTRVRVSTLTVVLRRLRFLLIFRSAVVKLVLTIRIITRV